MDTHGATGLYPSLAFDSADAPIIASYGATRGDLRLSKLYHGGWRSFTLDAEGDVGRHPALAVDPNSGLWTVAYEATGAGELRFVNAFNGGRVLGGVIDAKALGGSIALAFDGATSRARVGYADALSGEVRVATGTAAGWTTDVVGKGSAAVAVRPGGGAAGLVYRDKSGTLVLAERPAAQKAKWSSVEIGAGAAGSAAAFSAAGDVAVTQPGANPAAAAAPAVGERFAAAPSRVTVTHVDASTLRVDWLDNTVGESGFRIDSSADGGRTWRQAAVTGRNATATNVGGLTEGKTYAFRASAMGGAAEAVTASANAAAVPAGSSIDPLDTPGWFRISGIMNAGEERQYGLEDHLVVDHANWFYATSWATAVYQAVTGHEHVINTNSDYSVLDSGAFRVGYADEIRDQADVQKNISELPDEHTRTIAFEDSYGKIDRDFDDKYWTVDAEKAKLDLDVDSDNDDHFSPFFEQDEHEEALEEDRREPGKIIAVSDEDWDADGIPAFADGFSHFPDDPRSSVDDGNQLVPIVVALPMQVDPADVMIKLTYDASNPSSVRRTGSNTPNDPYLYSKGEGDLRIWKVAGTEARTEKSINDGGDFINTDVAFPASQLQFDNDNAATLYVEATSVSASLRDRKILLSVDLNGDKQGENFQPVDSVSLTAIQVKFDRTYSDQFSDIDANYADGKTGSEKSYILMATTDRGQNLNAHARADVSVSPNLDKVKNILVFGLYGDNAYGEVPESALTDGTVRLTGMTDTTVPHDPGGDDSHDPSQHEEEVDDMKILWGVDSAPDGKFDGSNALGQDSHIFKVVDAKDYDSAKSTLEKLQHTWSNTGLDFSANFLYCFLNDLPLNGAQSSLVNIRPNAFGLTHNVGAIFDAALDGPVRRNEFAGTSDLSQKITDSVAMVSLVRALLELQDIDLIKALGSWDPSSGPSPTHYFTFETPASLSSLSFGVEDPDLLFTIGKMTLNNPATPAHTPLKFGATAYYSIEDGARYLNIKDINVTGTGYDLYDFDYSSSIPFVSSAATVQAGFDTLGGSGHIYDSVFHILNVMTQSQKIYLSEYP